MTCSINVGCVRPLSHSGPCAREPALAQLRVWVLAAKNAEGQTIVFQTIDSRGLHFATRELAEVFLDSLPFRTAKNIRILMLESKE